jgi:ribosomal protein S18 acetylase RimI-like enzyme
MDHRLREYKPTDAGRVNELVLAAFAQYSSEYEDWNGFRRKISQMSRMAEFSELIIAEAASGIVGAVAYVGPDKPKAEFFRPEWALMRMLVVSPEVRGKGIGRALTQRCIMRAGQDKAGILALHTSGIMQAALSLYTKMGFVFYSEAPDIHGVKYSVYTKALPPQKRLFACVT